MKTKIKNLPNMRYLALILFYLALYTGCKKDPATPDPNPTLAVSADSVKVAAGANSTVTFEITSNTDWQIASSQPWLTVSQNTGNGNATITLTAATNNTSTLRMANVAVTVSSIGTKNITVSQPHVPVDKPNWAMSGVPDNEYSMTYIARASVGGSVQPVVEGDELVAFAGTQCRAVATIVSDNNTNCFYLLIYGKQNNNGMLSFKYFSKQNAWIFETLPVVTFTPNKLLGSPDAPFLIDFQ